MEFIMGRGTICAIVIHAITCQKRLPHPCNLVSDGPWRLCKDEPWIVTHEAVTSLTHLWLKLNGRDFVIGCHRCLRWRLRL